MIAREGWTMPKMMMGPDWEATGGGVSVQYEETAGFPPTPHAAAVPDTVVRWSLRPDVMV